MVRAVAALYLASVPLLAYTPRGADLSQALGGIFAATYFGYLMVSRRGLRMPRELVLFGIFVTYSLIGAFYARDVNLFISRQFTLVQLWILSLVLFNVLTLDPTGHIAGWRAIQLAMVAAGLQVLSQSSSIGRVSGPLGNPNAFGLAVLLAIGATLILPVHSRSARIAQVFLLGFFAWQATLSGSRKAIMALVILGGLLSVLVLARTVTRPEALVGRLLLLGVAGYGALVLLQRSPFWYRVENVLAYATGEPIREGSLLTRHALIEAGLQLWAEHPLVGVGLDQFRLYAPVYGLEETYAHSNPVEVLANFGLIGTGLYYGVYGLLSVRLLRTWWRARGESAKGHLLALAGAFWLTWMFLETAWVAYANKLHWIATTLVLATVVNVGKMRPSEFGDSPVGQT